MDLSDDLRLETPEQIDLEFELAGLGTRTVSWMVDALIKSFCTFCVFMICAVIAGSIGVAVKPDEDSIKFGVMFIAMIVLVSWFCYDVLFETWWSGQTPGKRLMGARVVRDGGAPVDFTATCIRNLLALGDFLPGGYLGGALLITLTPKRQRLGDIAAGTIVIRERQQSSPAKTQKVLDQFVSDAVTFTAAQLGRCTPEDRRILRSFFQRLFQMPPAARFKLASQLVATMTKRMETPPAEMLDGPANVTWLASLLRDLDRRAERGY